MTITFTGDAENVSRRPGIYGRKVLCKTTRSTTWRLIRRWFDNTSDGLFGLKTLRIKETDRIAALQAELAKVQVYLSPLPKRFSPKSDKEYFMIDGKAVVDTNPTFPTYEDHRQAMAIAPLAQLGQINVEEPEVV